MYLLISEVSLFPPLLEVGTVSYLIMSHISSIALNM